MEALRFGTFVWPNNPEKLTVEFRRSVEVKPTSAGLWTVTNAARFGRVFSGEGVFCGDDAYEQFRALCAYFYSGKTAELVHPQWDRAKAYLTELTVKEQSGEKYLRYRFSFQEAP